MKILVINGPNLDLLGTREPEIYGHMTLDQINDIVAKEAQGQGVEVQTYQSDCEGDIIKRIGQSREEGVDGIIINPAAYTHTSYGIRDALQAVGLPTIEVHLSNIYKREEFRRHSLTAPAAIGVISGFGYRGYTLALQVLAEKNREMQE